MSIIDINFVRSPYVKAYLAQVDIDEQLYFDQGDEYYDTLLLRFNVNTDYLPLEADVSNKVKNVLLTYINILAASDKIEVSFKQLNQGVVEDPWVVRYRNWKEQLKVLEADLTSDDFYDPDNLPPEDEDTSGNPAIYTWERS